MKRFIETIRSLEQGSGSRKPQLRDSQITVSSGGDLVTLSGNSLIELHKFRISPELFKPKPTGNAEDAQDTETVLPDIEFIEELVLSALRQFVHQTSVAYFREIRKITFASMNITPPDDDTMEELLDIDSDQPTIPALFKAELSNSTTGEHKNTATDLNDCELDSLSNNNSLGNKNGDCITEDFTLIEGNDSDSDYDFDIHLESLDGSSLRTLDERLKQALIESLLGLDKCPNSADYTNDGIDSNDIDADFDYDDVVNTDTAAGESNAAHSVTSKSDNAESDNAESGNAESDNAESDNAESDNAESVILPEKPNTEKTDG